MVLHTAMTSRVSRDAIPTSLISIEDSSCLTTTNIIIFFFVYTVSEIPSEKQNRLRHARTKKATTLHALMQLLIIDSEKLSLRTRKSENGE
jgi:hypothetical protein